MSLRILDKLPSAGALSWPQREDYVGFNGSDEQVHDANQSDTSHFLQLPREIRDMIYEYFLEAYRPSPPSPQFAGPRVCRYDKDEDTLKKDIAYPTSLPRSNVSALLHLNRSVRSEVLQLANKRNRIVTSLHADMDLMVSGHVIYPLWTRLPMLASPEVDLNVTITCRIFSPESICAPSNPPIPGLVFGRLFTLLGHFIKAGPAFTTLGKPHHKPPTVDKLTLKLHNYDIYTPRMFPQAIYEVVRACKAFSMCMPERQHVRNIRVVAEHAERKIPGFEGKEWMYEIKGDWDDLDPHLRVAVRMTMGRGLGGHVMVGLHVPFTAGEGAMFDVG